MVGGASTVGIADGEGLLANLALFDPMMDRISLK